MFRLALCYALAVILSFPLIAAAENWPGWRGPDGNGVSSETDLPTKWSADTGIKWKTPIPGVGHASPIVWQDKVFVTTAVSTNPEHHKIRKGRCHSARNSLRYAALSASVDDRNFSATDVPVRRSCASQVADIPPEPSRRTSV